MWADVTLVQTVVHNLNVDCSIIKNSRVLFFFFGGDRMDRALLVGLDLGNYDMKQSMNELASLAETLEIQVMDQFVQKAELPNGRTYVGSGKVQELKKAIQVLDIDIVIFDDELSPAQIRNLEKELEVQIMDRSFLILQIFSKRAQTKEAVLEVSLAQQRYMLPRLIGLSSSLSRQGGGSFNAKGAGETQLELDRRHIDQNISQLEKELDKILKEKETARKRRQNNAIPMVSLVGYTNVGKSATMNAILEYILKETSKTVVEKNMLFATLSTFSRRIKPEKKPEFILTDTVGFVSRLPHDLVRSFESTLSEVKHADLILYVMDGSSSLAPMQIETTSQVLKTLGADQIPHLYVLTHKDMMFTDHVGYHHDLSISNKSFENIDKLVDLIYQKTYGKKIIVTLDVPYRDHGVLHQLENDTTILSKVYTDTGTQVLVELYEKQLNQFMSYYKKEPLI